MAERDGGDASVALRYTVNCSMLFTDLPVLQRPAAARAAGFDAVEFWWPFGESVPADAEVDAFVHAIKEAGVQLSALNLAAGDLPAGDRGLVSDPAAQAAFRESVDIALAIAEVLGTRAFNALYGNRIAGVDPRHQDETAVDNLAYVGQRAERLGAVILVEPLSGVPAYPLRTAADVLAVIDRVAEVSGVTSLRLLADLYHLQVNGDDVGAVIDRHFDRIGLVQIADAPGRGAPGTGTMDVTGHLARLRGRGYDGYTSLEYRAAGPDPFGWLPRTSRAGQ